MTIDSILQAPLNRRTLSLVTIAMGLSACGGGSDEPSAPSEPPQITDHPADVTASAGESATFLVKVNSSTPTSYQWLRNGTPLDGATASELSLASIETTDSGSRFSVKVTNAAGSVQSNAATLLVQPRGWVEGIALASGALGALTRDRSVIGLSKSGDLFVWDRPARQLTRVTAEGQSIALQGSLQALNVNSWKLAVLEHPDGSLYVTEANLAPSGQINTEHGGGGKIHRISADGSHTVLYQAVISFGESPVGKLTPIGVAQDPSGNIYTLHFNSPALYRVPTTADQTPPSKFADLLPQPFEQLAIVLRYSVSLSLTSTTSGKIFASSTAGHTAFGIGPVTRYDAFDYEIGSDGTRSPIKFGATAAYSLITHGEHVYALAKNEQDYMCLVRRNPDGSMQLIAGGSGSETVPGPLSGGLGNWVRLAGVTPEGRIVLGDLALDETGEYWRYFVVTPPAI